MSEKQQLTVAEAGRKGGQTTAAKVASGELPKDYYSQIGRKGGRVRRKQQADNDG